MKYTINENISLLDALSLISPKSSKNTLRSWVKEGRVRIDQRLVKLTAVQLIPGQVVEVGQRRKFLEENVEILYEDSDLIVIDKPSGLLSVASAFEKNLTAHGVLRNYLYPKKVQIVHRLDQDTSGVMVFALSETAYLALKKIFAAHDIERQYFAVVEGKMKESHGKWESFLYEDQNYKVHETKDETLGKKAITHFKIKKTSRKYTWLELRLETGKKNQIRVHTQSCGHPIVGDLKYGAQSNPLKRVCLHAFLLQFNHPVTKKFLTFKSMVPAEFYEI